MKDYPNERDCEHGHLRRKCPICAAESNYAKLEARYTALREAVKRYFASAASEQKTCTEDMSDEEYHEWYTDRIAAVTGLERLLEEENERDSISRNVFDDWDRRIGALEEALKPFADESYRYDPDEDDDNQTAYDTYIKIGQLRAARRALEGMKCQKN